MSFLGLRVSTSMGLHSYTVGKAMLLCADEVDWESEDPGSRLAVSS